MNLCRPSCTGLQEVDPAITGPPVVPFYSIRNMQQGYVRGGVYAMLAIVVLTILHFRRGTPTLLALLPLGVAALWMVPCMALLDIQLNIANLVIIPLFMGMSIDNGIHLVDRALEPQNSRPAGYPEYGEGCCPGNVNDGHWLRQS